MVKQGTRVLVTGGAGFLGAHVTRALVAAGCPVRVLDDLSTGVKQRLGGLGGALELLQGDVRNPASVERALRGAHAVVHLAGVPTADDALRAQEVILGGALNVLNSVRALDKSQRPKVVLCGSGSVYGKNPAFVLHEELPPRPSLPQAVMAHAVEQYGRVYREAYGVPVTSLRIFRTFGPDEQPERADASVVARFVRAALDGTSPVIHGDGQQTRDLVYIDNVVAAIVAALSAPVQAEPLNIASGEAVGINFLWTLILELTGKKRLAIDPTYVPAPPWEPKHVRPQIARACKALDWAPSVRLRDALSRTVQHQRAMRTGDPNAWFTPKDELEMASVPRETKLRGTRSLPPPPPPDSLRPRGQSQSAPLRTPTPNSPNRTPTPTPPPMRTPTPVPQGPSGMRSRPTPLPVRPSLFDTPAARPTAREEKDEELDIEWAPVPSIPGMGR